MAYSLYKSDGTQLITLDDYLVDDTTLSIKLVGKNVSGYGVPQNENFIYLLENFASQNEPANALQGQLWFDKHANILRPKFNDGGAWRPISVLEFSDTSSISSQGTGDFWFNSADQQLYINTGSAYSLIGPEVVPGFGTTRMRSTAMLDNYGKPHPVIQMVLDNEVVSVMSPVTFASTTTNTVPGFNKVYRGLTFKNYSTSTRYTATNTDVTLHGLHDQLDRTYPRRDQDESISGNWTFNNDKMLQFGTAGQSKVQFQSSTGNLLIDNPTSGNTLTFGAGGFNLIYGGGTLTPNNPNIQDLGSASKRFNNVYTKNLNAGASAQTGALVGTWNLSQDSKLNPYGDGANSLGSDTLRFGNVYTFGLNSAGDTGTITGNWQIAHDNTLYSELDLAVDLGKTDKRFGTVFTGALSSGDSTATMYVTGDLSVDGAIDPKTNAGSDLGTPAKRWGNVYSRDADLSNAVIGKLTATIATLFDSASNTITQFDNDSTLTANSDARLPTQKAVKGYADTINNTLLTLINLVQTTLQDEINALQFVPVSAVFHVARSVCPTGFLVCDGTSYPTSAYPDLFSAIGYTYGGSGNRFNVPDLRGQFVRGFDGGASVDPGRLFGSTQSASVESHLHNIDTLFGQIDDRGGAATDRNGNSFQAYNQWGNDNDGDTGAPIFFAGTTYTAGGTETRPTNVAMLPIIKY